MAVVDLGKKLAAAGAAVPLCKFLGEAAECNDSLQTVIALQTSLRFAVTSCRVQTLLREQLELRITQGSPASGRSFDLCRLVCERRPRRV